MHALEYKDVNFPEDDALKIELSGLTVVLGANGAGKTSFLRRAHGIEQGYAWWNKKPAATSKQTRGFVAQSPIWLTGTVEKQLRLAGEWQGLSKADGDKCVADQLAQAGFAALKDRSPTTLSGGEQAKLALACARIHRPKVLLLDEVTAHLDPISAREFEADLTEFAANQGHLALFVTHDLMQAMRLAKNIIFLESGRVTYAGDAASFWKSDEIAIRQFVAGVAL